MTTRFASLTAFLLIAALGAMGSASAWGAQSQPSRLVKIGALTEAWGPTEGIVGLRDGLNALGLRENEHFVIGVRFTQGNLAELSEAAQGLIRRGVDLIVATEDSATKAAQETTVSAPTKAPSRPTRDAIRSAAKPIAVSVIVKIA